MTSGTLVGIAGKARGVELWTSRLDPFSNSGAQLVDLETGENLGEARLYLDRFRTTDPSSRFLLLPDDDRRSDRASIVQNWRIVTGATGPWCPGNTSGMLEIHMGHGCAADCEYCLTLKGYPLRHCICKLYELKNRENPDKVERFLLEHMKLVVASYPRIKVIIGGTSDIIIGLVALKRQNKEHYLRAIGMLKILCSVATSLGLETIIQTKGQVSKLGKDFRKIVTPGVKYVASISCPDTAGKLEHKTYSPTGIARADGADECVYMPLPMTEEEVEIERAFIEGPLTRVSKPIYLKSVYFSQTASDARLKLLMKKCVESGLYECVSFGKKDKQLTLRADIMRSFWEIGAFVRQCRETTERARAISGAKKPPIAVASEWIDKECRSFRDATMNVVCVWHSVAGCPNSMGCRKCWRRLKLDSDRLLYLAAARAQGTT